MRIPVDEGIDALHSWAACRLVEGLGDTDRYVPLHPILIELHTTWRDWAGLDDTGLLITNRGRPLDRYSVSRAVARSARIAGTAVMCTTRIESGV
jgi:integrase